MPTATSTKSTEKPIDLLTRPGRFAGDAAERTLATLSGWASAAFCFSASISSARPACWAVSWASIAASLCPWADVEDSPAIRAWVFLISSPTVAWLSSRACWRWRSAAVCALLRELEARVTYSTSAFATSRASASASSGVSARAWMESTSDVDALTCTRRAMASTDSFGVTAWPAGPRTPSLVAIRISVWGSRTGVWPSVVCSGGSRTWLELAYWGGRSTTNDTPAAIPITAAITSTRRCRRRTDRVDRRSTDCSAMSGTSELGGAGSGLPVGSEVHGGEQLERAVESSGSEQGRRRDPLAERRRVPAQDRVRVAAVRGPAQLARQVQRRRDLGPEVEREPYVVRCRAGHGVEDREPARAAVQGDGARVPETPVEPRVARVVCGPGLDGPLADLGDRHHRRRVRAPQERPGLGGLAGPVDLQRVVGQGG